MMKEYKVLAADLGASGGRVMLGAFDGQRLSIEEIHRFSNEAVYLNGTMYWDFLRLYHEIEIGIVKSVGQAPIESISVDTWGVDFGLLNEKGELLNNPVHYRDKRTKGMLMEGLKRIPGQELYELTGNQFMEINTAFQLLSLSKSRSKILQQADRLLFMPDLFHYYLSGVTCSEHSIASTSQMLRIDDKSWADKVLNAFDIPSAILPELVPSGTRLGKLRPKVSEMLGGISMEIIASAGHDTQSAMAAVPASSEDFIFISCGTWALFGTELSAPILSEQAHQLNITNEIGYDERISFLKNITGLFIIQECKKQWSKEGMEYSFGHLEQMAGMEAPFVSFIDPEAPEFMEPGDMPKRVRSFCKRTGQKIPSNEGEIVRCVNESLALSFRAAFEDIQSCTGKDYKVIHMVGGGTRSALLSQMTANACGHPVIAGPVEATVYGNAAVQLMAAGYIGNLKEARNIISDSILTETYKPMDGKRWQEAYERFIEIRRKREV